MGELTGIEWCHSTFNAIWGCQKVSPACDFCYAQTWDKRTGGDHWGARAPRRTFGPEHWNKPRVWDRKARKNHDRYRVFSSSMGDNFEDHPVVMGELLKLWALIRETLSLDWLLLTKRANRIKQSLPADWGDGWPNVWMGATVEDQKRADLRVPDLIEVPAHVRFLSIEPLLAPIELRDEWLERLHWIILGGESGSHARAFDVESARRIRDRCKEHGVKVFVKQLGVRPVIGHERLQLIDKTKGKDHGDWPADLRVFEFPESAPRQKGLFA